MNRQQTDLDMVATEYRNGQATRYEVVHQPQAQPPYIIGADDAPITSPVAADRLPRVQHIVTSDAIGESRAFNIRVSSLALVLAGGVVLAAAVFGPSLSFWSLLAWFGTVYAAVWAVAFGWDTMRSAGGVELVNTLHLWRFLRREQEFRHSRYDVPQRPAPAWLGPVLLAGAVGFGGLFLLLILGAVFLEQMPK